MASVLSAGKEETYRYKITARAALLTICWVNGFINYLLTETEVVTGKSQNEALPY